MPDDTTTAHEPSYDTGPGGAMTRHRALMRCTANRMAGGVCAGIAEALEVDVTVVRVIAVALAILGGLAVPAYAAAWLLIPDEDTNTSIAEQLLGQDRRW